MSPLSPLPPFNIQDVANFITGVSQWLVHYLVTYPMVAVFFVILLAIMAYLPPIVWLIGLLIIAAVLTTYHLW